MVVHWVQLAGHTAVNVVEEAGGLSRSTVRVASAAAGEPSVFVTSARGSALSTHRYPANGSSNAPSRSAGGKPARRRLSHSSSFPRASASVASASSIRRSAPSWPPSARVLNTSPTTTTTAERTASRSRRPRRDPSLAGRRIHRHRVDVIPHAHRHRGTLRGAFREKTHAAARDLLAAAREGHHGPGRQRRALHADGLVRFRRDLSGRDRFDADAKTLRVPRPDRLAPLGHRALVRQPRKLGELEGRVLRPEPLRGALEPRQRGCQQDREHHGDEHHLNERKPAAGTFWILDFGFWIGRLGRTSKI